MNFKTKNPINPACFQVSWWVTAANTLELHCGECHTLIASRENRSHTAFMAACRQATHEVQYLPVLAVRPLLAP